LDFGHSAGPLLLDWLAPDDAVLRAVRQMRPLAVDADTKRLGIGS
jgi:hypothetical protein